LYDLPFSLSASCIEDQELVAFFDSELRQLRFEIKIILLLLFGNVLEESLAQKLPGDVD